MPSRRILPSFAMIVVLLLKLAFAGPSLAAAYDLGADFSFAQNPNGVWQYGYSATQSLATNDFLLMGLADTQYPIGFWHPSSANNADSGYYPYVACNPTASTLTDATGQWAARAREVAMEASNSGQYSLVRFVAAMSGLYQVDAAFAGIHSGLSTTDVRVLHNAAALFEADIDGYGGDPAFHPVVGTNPNAAYSGLLLLQANDLLTFAVGFGSDGNHFSDTTGLFVHIEPVAGPTIISIATLGGTNTIVSFTSILGASHELQARDDLGFGSWSTFTNQISGTGGILQVSDPSPHRLAHRFYRVVASF